MKRVSLVNLTKRPRMGNYVRTPEDELNDRLERAWKEQVNRSACSEFLRRNPSGRPPLN